MTLPCRALAGAIALALGGAIETGASSCPPDAVRVGPVCIDKYEGSVWRIPPEKKTLIRKVQQGRATSADLLAGGATQLGCGYAPFDLAPYSESFPDTGDWTEPVYAASVAGVLPSSCTSWFQAEQACALSGKRLITNQEWQRAAAGTPDPGASDDGATKCNVGRPDPANPGFRLSAPSTTGSRAACVSKWGVFEMIGNVGEWVGDWGERGTNCELWSEYGPEYGADVSCWASNGSFGVPGGVVRGGSYSEESGGTNAGTFAARLSDPPNYQTPITGFRCAR
jgi:formylglycine-generating enzyme required for sulfatase activity